MQVHSVSSTVLQFGSSYRAVVSKEGFLFFCGIDLYPNRNAAARAGVALVRIVRDDAFNERLAARTPPSGEIPF